jgi:hypothetical protein
MILPSALSKEDKLKAYKTKTLPSDCPLLLDFE